MPQQYPTALSDEQHGMHPVKVKEDFLEKSLPKTKLLSNGRSNMRTNLLTCIGNTASVVFSLQLSISS